MCNSERPYWTCYIKFSLLLELFRPLFMCKAHGPIPLTHFLQRSLGSAIVFPRHSVEESFPVFSGVASDITGSNYQRQLMTSPFWPRLDPLEVGRCTEISNTWGLDPSCFKSVWFERFVREHQGSRAELDEVEKRSLWITQKIFTLKYWAS